ncbi:MAG: glycosyltransferase family 2 protein [Candidatus Pacearchaeota archaeon]
MISCIIPAYNEEKFIKDVIEILKKCEFIDEIIVVSDGSTDNTALIAESLNVNKVIQLEKNIGKAGAIFEGLKYAKGDIVILVDADLRGLTEKNLYRLVKPILENTADMTIGSGIPFVMNKFSGLRALRKWFLEKISKDFPDYFKSLEYNIENELNTQAKILGLRVKYIKMEGVRNVHKIKKYGLKEGLKRTLKMYLQLALYPKKIRKRNGGS